MKLYTRQVMANEAATRWHEEYRDTSYWHRCEGTDKEPRRETHAKLVALGPTPDPDAVDAIIGNGSWTRPPECDECAAVVDVCVRVGNEPDYESGTAWICVDCLTRALGLARGDA